MNRKFRFFWKYVLLLTFAGYIYVILELIFRSKTDISMLFTASICALPIVVLNDIFSYDMKFFCQIGVCTIYCTAIEYIVGRYIVNQNYTIWDYRNLMFNLDGQVCLLFSMVWALISMITIPLFDYFDYVVFDGPRPYYKILNKIIFMPEKK